MLTNWWEETNVQVQVLSLTSQFFAFWVVHICHLREEKKNNEALRWMFYKLVLI